MANIAPGLENLAGGLNVLFAIMRRRMEEEGQDVAAGVAEYVLASYRARDPNLTLEPARLGLVRETERRDHVAVRGVTREVALCFRRHEDGDEHAGDDK